MEEKALFFDAGPVITLIMSRMEWILPRLKEHFGGHFYITPAVRLELVERPLQIHRFQFEALQTLKLINEGILEVRENIPQQKVSRLINLANTAFRIKNKAMDIIQSGEVQSVAAASALGAAVVMDERTLRLLIENSSEVGALLELRFKKEVVSDPAKIRQFSQELGKLKIIRSIELVAVAYRLGLLDSYIPKIKGGRGVLVEAILWATKYNGCAVTEEEIEDIKSFLIR